MKKIAMMLAAAAAVVMSSCGGSSSAPTAQLSTEEDSLCYAFGASQGTPVKEYAFSEQGLGLDSAYLDDFVKGLIDGANLDDSKSKAAYYAGIGISSQLASFAKTGLRNQLFGPDADSTCVVNVNDVIAALVAAVKGDASKLGDVDPQMYIQTKSQEINAKNMEKQYGDYKKENEDYMKKIAKSDSVKTLAGGVCYKVEKQGNGATPKETDRVKVHYEGKTIDGNVFDSSYKRGEPAEFACNQVIKGWTTALTNMPVGSKWTLYIPADAAYGAQNMQVIKPFSTLIFTVELLDIIKADKAEDAQTIEIQ